MNKFSNNTIEGLKYYVYVLTFRENNEDIIFYVGKGKANRVFEHFNAARKVDLVTIDKKDINVEKINTINNKETSAFIVKAELSNEEALNIESTLISVMRRFPHQKLTNMVKGHHTFEPENVFNIDSKYSTPISLEEFSKANKIKILVLKCNEESYYNSINKDFRGFLEGIWKLDSEKINKIHYIVGVLKGNIFGVYKYIPGSYRRVDDSWIQEEWDRWNQVHILMGRPAHYFTNKEDDAFNAIKAAKKGVLKLIPISIPKSQTVIQGKISDKDMKIGKQLINKNITDKKVSRSKQGSRFYFGLDTNN